MTSVLPVWRRYADPVTSPPAAPSNVIFIVERSAGRPGRAGFYTTASSRQVIHRVGQLERAFRVAAIQIALLVAQAQHDRIPLLRELASLRRFEIDRALERGAVRLQ